MDCWECWHCGKNGTTTGGLEIHHIKGRESDSILNASILCGDCHSHIGHSLEEEKKLLLKAIKNSVRFDYQFSKADLRFYAKHKKVYDSFERNGEGYTDSHHQLSTY